MCSTLVLDWVIVLLLSYILPTGGGVKRSSSHSQACRVKASQELSPSMWEACQACRVQIECCIRCDGDCGSIERSTLSAWLSVWGTSGRELWSKACGSYPYTTQHEQASLTWCTTWPSLIPADLWDATQVLSRGSRKRVSSRSFHTRFLVRLQGYLIQYRQTHLYRGCQIIKGNEYFSSGIYTIKIKACLRKNSSFMYSFK